MTLEFDEIRENCRVSAVLDVHNHLAGSTDVSKHSPCEAMSSRVFGSTRRPFLMTNAGISVAAGVGREIGAPAGVITEI